MRLIKLKIKNIASLKNEHCIDFSFIQNQAPLFAITGETGAGKSIFLEALSLALGNRADLSSLQNKNKKCIVGRSCSGRLSYRQKVSYST